MPKTARLPPTIWDVPASRSEARRIQDWERHCTLLASIPGAHQEAWLLSMMNSIISTGRERVPC